MKISNIKEMYAAGHKFDMVDFVANGNRSTDGGRPCFACHALQDGIAYGFFNLKTKVMRYGTGEFVDSNAIKGWSEGSMAMYLKSAMGANFGSLICVLETDGSWSSRLLLQNTFAYGNSETCRDSIFIAVNAAYKREKRLSMIVEDMAMFFGHDAKGV